tara:strand:+ start:1151 stop:1540 length:390 start_codon:yes stop_codon:yes gene_type:complete
MNLAFIDFNALAEAVSTIGLPAVIILFILVGSGLGLKWLIPKAWRLLEDVIKNKIQEQEVKDSQQDNAMVTLQEEVDNINSELVILKLELSNSKSISKERHTLINNSIIKLENTVEKLTDHLFELIVKK